MRREETLSDRVKRAMRREGRATAVTLARSIGARKGSVSDVLVRAVRDGWAVRVPGPTALYELKKETTSSEATSRRAS